MGNVKKSEKIRNFANITRITAIFNMKKFLSFVLTFLIIGALVAGGCQLLGLNGSDLSENIFLGFAGAMGGTFGPILAAWVSKKLKK